MNYICCGGYRHLFLALYLHKLGKDTEIITYNKDTKKFFDYIDIECVYYSDITPDLKSFYKLNNKKKQLDKLIEEIDFKSYDNFYFLSNIFSFGKFYLAKEFSKIGNVYYKNSERDFKKYKFTLSKLKDKNFYNHFFRYGKIFFKFLLKIFWDLDLVFYEINNKPVYGIDKKFLNKHNIKKLLPDKNYEELISEVIKDSNILEKKYDNLLLIMNLSSNYIKKDSIKKLYKKISNMKCEIVIKKHPKPCENISIKEEKIFNIFRDFEELPRFIPVELTFKNIKRNVLGVCSVSLKSSSSIKNINTISLLELLEWNDKSYKKEIKDVLLKASSDIIFPENFEDLKEILELKE